jgi:hypothetical protein
VGFFISVLELCASSNAENPEAQLAAAIKLPANARSILVDRAEPRHGVQGDAGSVSALLHAANAVMFDHKLFRHVVYTRHEFDHLVAAAATAGTGGKIVRIVRGDGRTRVGMTCPGWRRLLSFREEGRRRRWRISSLMQESAMRMNSTQRSKIHS